MVSGCWLQVILTLINVALLSICAENYEEDMDTVVNVKDGQIGTLRFFFSYLTLYGWVTSFVVRTSYSIYI
jgi:hypothetical protein